MPVGDTRDRRDRNENEEQLKDMKISLALVLGIGKQALSVWGKEVSSASTWSSTAVLLNRSPPDLRSGPQVSGRPIPPRELPCVLLRKVVGKG